MCPPGFVVSRQGQSCELTTCEDGRVRASDGVHCCWPGQAWSTRESCIGIPQCPAGMEAKGETCISVDLDGDGVPNAVDACPTEAEDRDGFEDEDGCPDPDNDKDGILDAADACRDEPEDKNGFKDDDGCPDEPERLALVAAEARVAAAKAEAKRRRDAEAEKRRAHDAAMAAYRDDEDGRTGRRRAGMVLAGIGGGTALLTGIFMGLGASTNSAIADGGFATADEIESKNDSGKAFNVLAIVSGSVTGALLAVGLPLWLANGSKEAPRLGFTGQGLQLRF